MVSVRIGNEERKLEEADPSWIHQIDRRHAEGQQVCVRVTIREGPLDMILSTPNCVSSRVGGHQANRDELQVIQLWDKLHLNTHEFTSGNLEAFLKQLRRLI